MSLQQQNLLYLASSSERATLLYKYRVLFTRTLTPIFVVVVLNVDGDGDSSWNAYYIHCANTQHYVVPVLLLFRVYA